MVEQWEEEADQAGLSRAEWLRYQIEAGRKQVAALDPRTEDAEGNDLKETVLTAVPEDETTTPEDVVSAVLDPIEGEIYDCLSELDEADQIGYDPVEGGYRRK